MALMIEVITGYLSVWLVFGIAAHSADWLLHQAVERSPGSTPTAGSLERARCCWPAVFNSLVSNTAVWTNAERL